MIAVAGLAVATAVGGFALATSAQAAPPTLALSAPTSVQNDSTPAATPITITVDNSGGTTIPAAGTDALTLTISGVGGLACSNITLTPVASAALTAGGTFGTCTFTESGYTLGADLTDTLTYTLKVEGAPLTGTLSSQATLTNTTGTTTTTVASSTVAHTTLTGPTVTPPPAPAVSLTAPASLTNDGSTTGTVGITVNNTGVGRGVIPSASDPGNSATLSLTIGGVSGVGCANISITGAPALTTTDVLTPCTFKNTAYTQAAGSNVTNNYTISVNSPTHTGTLSLQANLTETDLVNGNQVTEFSANSNTATTALGTPGAPTFVSTAVPAAIVYHTYSFQFGTDGTPAVTAAGLHAFTYAKNSTGGYTCSTSAGQTDTTGTVTGTANHVYVSLSNGFVYDVTGGKILHSAVLTNTDWQPAANWVLIANNNEGGAATPVAGACPATTTTPTPTPTVAKHDVLSHPFTLPVLFSDVSPSSLFANAIYTLAQQGAINGFADGTYRPAAAVTRATFAAILGRRIGTPDGVCSGNGSDRSPFPDVSDNSPFCEEILHLSRDGVINGYPNGTFHPGATIIRGAIAALFYRAYNFVHHRPTGDALCTTPIPFNDVTANNVFCGDIEWMASNHYANGYPDGGFHPRATTTRDVDAAFMFRVFPTAP